MPKIVLEIDSDKDKKDIKLGLNISVSREEINEAMKGIKESVSGAIGSDTILKLAKSFVTMLNDMLNQIEKSKERAEK